MLLSQLNNNSDHDVKLPSCKIDKRKQKQHHKIIIIVGHMTSTLYSKSSNLQKPDNILVWETDAFFYPLINHYNFISYIVILILFITIVTV